MPKAAKKTNPPVSPVPARSLRQAKRVLLAEKISLDDIASPARLKPDVVSAALDGLTPIAATDPVAQRVVHCLIQIALTGATRGQRDRTLTLARSIAPDSFATAYTRVEQLFVLDAIGRRKLMGSGFKVAPYLSAGGKLVIVAIDGRNCLGCAGEVGSLSGGTFQEPDNNTWDNPDWTSAEWRTAEDIIHKRNDDIYDHRFLDDGVHVAPWRPWNCEAGCCLVALDKKSRLVASVDVEDEKDGPAVLAAWKAMRMALDAITLDVPWDENTDPDDDLPGDEWKKGA